MSRRVIDNSTNDRSRTTIAYAKENNKPGNPSARGKSPRPDQQSTTRRGDEVIYEREKDDGLYVDMSSRHLGLYVTGDVTTPQSDHSDEEHIYEEVNYDSSRKPPAVRAVPSGECRRVKPPRPKPPKQLNKSNLESTPRSQRSPRCQEADHQERRSLSPRPAGWDDVKTGITCCHCDRQRSTLSESTDDQQSLSNTHDIDDRGTMTVLVRSLSVLHRGDHVAWKRAIGIWHHAIVLDVDAVSGQLEVIHYSGGVIPDEESGGTFASVRREKVAVSVRSKDLYRVDYDPQLLHCFSPEAVVERAMSRLHESEYNPLTHNCEHFARWCKTGEWRSVQVEQIPRRVRAARDKFAEAFRNEGPLAMAKNSVAKISLKPTATAAEHMALKGVRGIVVHAAPSVERKTKSLVDREEILSDRLCHKLQQINNVYHTVIGTESRKTNGGSEDKSKEKGHKS